MRRILRQRLDQVLLGGLRLLHLLFEDLAEAVVDVDLLLRVGRHAQQAPHHLDGAIPLLGLLVEARQARERVDVIRLDVEDVAVGVDGALEIAQLGLVDVAHLRVERDAILGVVGGDDVLAVGVDQRLPLALLLVEALEIAVRLLVAIVDEQDLLQHLGGAVGLGELLLPQRRHALVDLDAVAFGRRDLELVLEVLEVLLHAAGLLIQGVERLERRQVLRVDREHFLVRLDGALVVAEPVLPQLADLQLEAHRELGVVDDLRLLRQHLDQAIPGLRAAVQALERVDGVDAALVVVERALVGEHRLRGVADLRLVGVGELQQDVDARLRLLLDLGVAREHRHQVVPALLLAEEVLERGQRADVRVVQLQRLLRRRDGVVDVLERRVVPARDLHPQIGGDLGIGDPLHHLRVVADELVPLVGHRRQALELLGDVIVRVVLAERGLQRHERVLAIAELLLVGLGHLRERSDARRRVGHEVRARQQQVDQLDPALALPIELLELVRRRHVAGVDLQHALVDLGRRAAVADLVGPQRRDLHEHVDLLGRRRQRLRAPLEDLDALFPARLLREQLLERRQRAEVVRVELEHLAPGVDRLLRAHEGLALELAELRVELLELRVLDAGAAELRDLDQAAQRLRQLLPGARRLVVLGDGAQGVDVLRVELQHLLPALERVALARELLAPDAAEALVDRDLGVDVLGRRHLLLEDLGQLFPLAGRLVQIGEARERDRCPCRADRPRGPTARRPSARSSSASDASFAMRE